MLYIVLGNFHHENTFTILMWDICCNLLWKNHTILPVLNEYYEKLSQISVTVAAWKWYKQKTPLTLCIVLSCIYFMVMCEQTAYEVCGEPTTE